MTTAEKVPAGLVVDFDVYDPALAAPVASVNQLRS